MVDSKDTHPVKEEQVRSQKCTNPKENVESLNGSAAEEFEEKRPHKRMKPGEKVESQNDSATEVTEEQKPLSCDKDTSDGEL